MKTLVALNKTTTSNLKYVRQTKSLFNLCTYSALYVTLYKYRDNLSCNHVLFPYHSYINLRGFFHITVRFLIILFFWHLFTM